MLTILYETQDITSKILDDTRLQSFWIYWQETAHQFGDFKAIAKDDISPVHFRGYLDYLTLVDAVDDGEDFRYRIYGTGVARHFGRDMTGKLVSELPTVSAEFQIYFYQQVYFRRHPVFMITEGHPDIPVRQWSRLCLPVTTDGMQIDQMLNLALPTKVDQIPDHYL